MVCFEGNTTEIHGSEELVSVYKSLEDFIADLEGLALEPTTTASELEDVLGTRHIVTNVARFYNEYNNAYHATIWGLFVYYKSDKGYRANGPKGNQLLVLKHFEPKPGQQD